MLRKLRRQRLSARVSLLAITALLWSQMLLAFHADCASTVMAGSPAETAAPHADCVEPTDATDRAVCQLHCSQGDASSDTSRIAAVPAAGPLLPVPVMAVLRLVAQGAVAPAPQRNIAWHRPTPNPASILLI